MITTLLVDDEKPARNKLRRFLDGDSRFVIVDEAEDGPDALEKIARHRPQLVFLDIQMPGMNGFEVVLALQEAPPMIVFATAYDQYAVRAFEARALDYLLKPFDRERFQRTLSAVIQHGAPDAAVLQQLLQQLHGPDNHLKRIMIRQGKRLLPVDLNDVFRISAEEKYVRLFKGDRSYLYRETLSAMADKLDPAVFVRVHRGDIVNMNFIDALEPWTRGSYLITLKNGVKLNLSSSWRDPFFQAFGG